MNSPTRARSVAPSPELSPAPPDAPSTAPSHGHSPATVAALVLAALASSACSPINVDPERATRPYPREILQTTVAQIQVIPEATSIDVVNATARSYRDFDLWLNQRYMVHIDALEAGKTLSIPLSHFWDWRGEGPFEGGIFRYYAPTPIVLVQAQLTPTAPFIGFLPVLPEGSRDFYENPAPLPEQRGGRR